MSVIFLFLAYAWKIVRKIGSKGIDATTRIVGFFVAIMGMGLIFHGLIEFLQTYHLLGQEPKFHNIKKCCEFGISTHDGSSLPSGSLWCSISF